MNTHPGVTPNQRSACPSFQPDSLVSAEFLSELIHKIGHEVGNPLTAIISLASIIERFSGESEGSDKALPSDKIASYAASIGDEAWKISEISERLVMILSTKSGNQESCDLNRLLDRTIKRLKTRKRNRRFEVHLHHNAEEVAAFTDPEQTQLLISELLSNAEQIATAKTSPSDLLDAKKIQVRLGKESEYAFIQIENYSPAPCPFELETLSNPFVTEFGDHKHLGLGLTMAQTIVKRQNGEISFKETKLPTGGYRFTVEVKLPLPRNLEE